MLNANANANNLDNSLAHLFLFSIVPATKFLRAHKKSNQIPPTIVRLSLLAKISRHGTILFSHNKSASASIKTQPAE